MNDATNQPRLPTWRVCPQCNLAPLKPRHCKAVCDECGYVESCEDLMPFAQPVVLAERTMAADTLTPRRFPGARA